LSTAKAIGVVWGIVCLALLGGVTVALGQRAEITTWAIPTPDSLPASVGVAPDGTVYFTEFSGAKIGLLDPATNEIKERGVNGSPSGLYVADAGTVYYTLPNESALEILVFIGGGNRWSVPAPGSWPERLIPDPSGPGQVNLWLNERLAGRVARFSPSQVAVTLPLITVSPVSVSPTVVEVDPTVSSVAPQSFPGNPALPPPIVYAPGVTTGAFTEWTAMDTTKYVEDVAVTPDGKVWFCQGMAPLSQLDPASDTLLLYGLPPGTNAIGVTVDGAGNVWFADVSRPAIGMLDPTTGDVTIWPIPGGVQPIDLEADSIGGVWFIDREADDIGYLSPMRNEVALYPLPDGSRPVALDLEDDVTVWFVCERGNVVGRLSIIPVLGPPPVPPTPGAGCVFPAYSISQSGSEAEITLTYEYDGSAGLPVWIGVLPMVEGTTVSEFNYTPVEVTEPGRNTVTIHLTYTGTGRLETDALWFHMFRQPTSEVICERQVEFPAVWIR